MLKMKIRKIKKYHKKNLQAGFTLVELLTVLSIISLISSIVASQVKFATERAADTKRYVDSQTLQKGMELYYQDNGSYPMSTATDALASDAAEWDSDIGQKLKGSYVQGMPQSVRPTSISGVFAYSLYGTIFFARGTTLKVGQIIFIPFDSASGHYSQAHMWFNSQFGCLRQGSYIIAMYQANPDPPAPISIVTVNGVRYGVNKLILGGNYTFPYTDSLTNCPEILNP
jgi:prepilin-type N-terminal cleavage/methylation domain-containing protein